MSRITGLTALVAAVALATVLGAPAINLGTLLGSDRQESQRPPRMDDEETQRMIEEIERQNREDRENFPAPGVLLQGETLSREIYAQDLRLGQVTDLARGDFIELDGDEIAIVGSRGAAFHSAAGDGGRKVQFQGDADRVDLIDVEGDGEWEYLNRGSWGVAASVFNADGSLRWTYGGAGPGVDDMAAGDVDGDGALEFAVGFNGGGGVHLLESDGSPVWRQSDGNVWHVEIADTDSDGTPEVIHSNAGGMMRARSATDGSVLSQRRPPTYFAHFSQCRWPTAEGVPHLVFAEGGRIHVLSTTGQVVFSHSDPHAGTMGDARATPVRLSDADHFAVLVDFHNFDRAILFVFDAEGSLTHKEVFPESCMAVAAFPVGDEEGESLLVGGTTTVWLFSAVD